MPRRAALICWLLLVAISAVAVARADESFNLPAAKTSGLQKRSVRLSEYSIVLAKPGAQRLS